MAPPLLTLRDIRLTYGRLPLLDGASLSVAPGDRICLVGRNGSGKSTLLRIAAGLVEPDSGERYVDPAARIGVLAQEQNLSSYSTAYDYVVAGLSPADDPHIARRYLEKLGLTGDENPQSLSGGEARRVALARVLAPRPDVLLLDEPTNHLDLPAILWLEAELKAARAAIVLISHDRRFLENLSQTTVWLDRGQARRLEQGFAAFEAWRDKTLEEEETARHKLERKIERENQWMHGGVTARRKRNVRRVRELADMRRVKREERRAQGNVVMAADGSGLSGRLVIEALGIAKAYGDRAIVRDFSTRILRGDRVGIIGANGAGKTTLLKMLIGDLAPDSGSVRLGTNIEMLTLDQRRDELKPDWTLADALTGGKGDQVVVNGKARHVASYLADFLFLSEQVRSPCRVLSGGERARLMLARALLKPSNLMVLDEPTNDLDLETLDLLQELIADYAGTVILVSHDRDFLDRVVTSTVVAEGDGRWVEYAGGYSDLAGQGSAAPGVMDDTVKKPRREATASVESAPAAASTAAPPTPRRKLSFKEKHALETLPGTIEKLTAEIGDLQGALADPALFTRDRARFEKATARLTAAQAELTDAEDRWLELEALREELDA
jgi:ATP-binding cassette subfamily F protein uup